LPGFAADAVAVQMPTDITSAIKNPSAEIQCAPTLAPRFACRAPR
jgi:hypothetical protein